MFRSIIGACALNLLVISHAFACACGCGIFEVGTGSMIPTAEGGTAWLEYDFMDQHTNWHGANQALTANNSDKKIRTDFLTLGSNYMFNREFGIEAEIPYWRRAFNTTDDQGNSQRFHHSSVGDIRLKGIWTGLSDDMSTGFTFGLKFPTGDYSYANFDRDTEIGTGSTDWLLGAYHMGELPMTHAFDWFVDGQWEHAFSINDNYRPGDEIDMAIGSYYTHGKTENFGSLSPLLEILGSIRARDQGSASVPTDSGYTRLLIAPGLEYEYDSIKLYADVEVPIYQFTNGNQLTAPWLSKVSIATHF